MAFVKHRTKFRLAAFVALSVMATLALPAAAAIASPGARPPSRDPTIAFVPLDDRPVTYQLPIMLGAIAGQPVLSPPRDMLGNYLHPGDGEAILGWLRSNQTTDASAVVASSDMLAYGGLVAARVPGPSAADAFVRLRALGRLRAERAIPFVGVFGTIMRLAPTGVPALGPAATYYATGQTVDDIQAYANLPDPPLTEGDRARAARLRADIGPALDVYLATRARDLAVDEWALQMAADGGYDRIVLGQDDAGPVGLHLKDVTALKATVQRFGLGSRASIEPGADELGMVMLARVFARNVAWTPTVAVTYSRPDGGTTIDRLEYVPIDTTIGRIIDACGAKRVPQSADIALYVRVPDTGDEDERAFEGRLADDVAQGRSVAVADLSFLQGDVGPAQQELTQALIARGIAGNIDAFASWNTDANTIGTALPEAIAAGAGRRAGRYDPRAHAQFMLDRYADDYAFHQFVRPQLNAALRAHGIDTTLLLPEIAAQTSDDDRAALWRHAVALLHDIYPQYADAGLTITLPWDRTFETQIDVRLTPATKH
ncbi:MAG: DUF4127 family protein [Candidatus Eremiobacteraeota bacterium]|nr:DUF4127 family protein [Candidatus Eremiobacteraeota bacterium]MBC5821598.1 DUF4127 family protein [Candidatus Eremiobacteraeota bacterium]